MHDRYPKKVCCAVLCAIVWTGATVTAYGEDPAIAKRVASGTVEGSVIYHADSKRPWRYSRYYIKDAKSGELAEAVVALRGRGLSPPRDHEPATVKIDQKNFQFLPETVAIRRGDSVTFTNSDQATHNIQSSGDLANFNVTIPAGGEGYSVRFDRAGGIRRPAEVGCVFHSNMRAWVFVFDHGYFQITKADGGFQFAEVPPGEYELEMVHPAGGLHWRQKIEVKAGDALRANIVVSPADSK